MKIFSVINNSVSYNKTGDLALFNTRQPAFLMLPDTVLTTCNRPFFIPDYALPCQCSVQVGVRISRLGRCISQRFAYRYYDAATVAAVFTARQMLEWLQAGSLPWSAACCFDGCVAMGRFEALGPQGVQALPFMLELDGQAVQSGNMSDLATSVDELIAHVSRFVTLRQGDVLLAGALPCSATDVVPGCRLTARLGGEALLDFHVK